MCTRRRPDRSRKHFRTLAESLKTTAFESPKFKRELASKVALAMVERFNFPNLAPHLVGTDRILQRWAADSTGMPSDNPDVYAVARPPPLDPKTQMVVGDIVKAAPAGMRHFVADWYRRGVPTPAMAEARQLSVRQLNREWEAVLVYMRQQFLLSAHADLTTLVRQLP